MATRRFADRDAPSLLRELLGSLSVDASHASGPLEHRAGMDWLAPDIAVESTGGGAMTNDSALMITGKKLLRAMDSAAHDAYVLVEPRIGPALSLSRLDFRRGSAHLLGLLSAWRAECAEHLEFARAVTEMVRRSILGPSGIIALVGKTPKCRVVTNVATSLFARGVLSVVAGPRAVARVAADRIGQHELADVAADRPARSAIMIYEGKLLPVIDGRLPVTDDIMHDWFVFANGEDDGEEEEEDASK